MSNAVTDYENLGRSFSEAKGSAVQSRWERKKRDNEQRRAFTSSNSSSVGADRFIPNRSKMNLDISRHNLSCDTLDSDNAPMEEDALNDSIAEGQRNNYKAALSSVLLGEQDKSGRVLAFGDKAPVPKGDVVNNLNVLYSTSVGHGERKKTSNSKLVSRQISSKPSRVLDAPELMDDYYLNLVSWSDTNIVAVALQNTVYLWNAGSGDIAELCTVEGAEDAYVSSVSWVQQGGNHIAVGTSMGTTQLWDVQACKQLRSMEGHSERVSSLAWNQHMLSTAGLDSVVVNHDVRQARHQIATLSSHTQEVCQLAWSHDGKTLASGANDNKVCLWDVTSSFGAAPRFELTDHQAAVKALAWSPHERNLLASGGGTADRTIKFWNTRTGSLLNSIDTESQVSGLQWNPFEKEILSSHGFSKNHMCLWKYPTMAKIKELEGHTERILHMAISPDGGTVLSAGADESLRFWDVFAPSGKSKSGKRGASSSQAKSELPLSADFMRPMQIR